MNSEHDRHDRVLVARYAAGDAYPSETDKAKGLVDNCDQCASLAADIQLISARTSQLPQVSRPRDFRISAQQAEQLRGSWFDRLMRNFQSPGWTFVRPLAGAALAVGLVLIVVGALPLNGFTSRTATDAIPGAGVSTQSDLKASAVGSAHAQQPAASSAAAPISATAAAAAQTPPPEQQPVSAPGSATYAADNNASTAPPPPYVSGPAPSPAASAGLGAAMTSEPPASPKQRASLTPRPEPSQEPEVAAVPSQVQAAVPPPQAPNPSGNALVSVDSTSSVNQSALLIGGLILTILALMALAVVWIARRRYSDPLAR